MTESQGKNGSSRPEWQASSIKRNGRLNDDRSGVVDWSWVYQARRSVSRVNLIYLETRSTRSAGRHVSERMSGSQVAYYFRAPVGKCRVRGLKQQYATGESGKRLMRNRMSVEERDWQYSTDRHTKKIRFIKKPSGQVPPGHVSTHVRSHRSILPGSLVEFCCLRPLTLYSCTDLSTRARKHDIFPRH